MGRHHIAQSVYLLIISGVVSFEARVRPPALPNATATQRLVTVEGGRASRDRVIPEGGKLWILILSICVLIMSMNTSIAALK